MPDDITPSRLPALATAIQTEVAAAERDFVSAVQHAIRAGELLIEAKADLAHGAWGPWLAENGFAARTATTYMRLARNRPRAADLPSVRQAVAALAAPREDEEMTAERAEEFTEDLAEAHQEFVYGPRGLYAAHRAGVHSALGYGSWGEFVAVELLPSPADVDAALEGEGDGQWLRRWYWGVLNLPVNQPLTAVQQDETPPPASAG